MDTRWRVSLSTGWDRLDPAADQSDHLGKPYPSYRASPPTLCARGIRKLRLWLVFVEKAEDQGITSLMSFSLMYICSLQVVRRKIYEFFLVSHICLAALFLGGVIMHWNAVSIWIYVRTSFHQHWTSPSIPVVWSTFPASLTSSPG